MDEPADRWGRAWGVGCFTPWPAPAIAAWGGLLSSLCGVGCWTLVGPGGGGRAAAAGREGPLRAAAAEDDPDAARAVRKSWSAPKSSSIVFLVCVRFTEALLSLSSQVVDGR